VLEREQFGKPIGSFQAVKHRCADMAVRAEAIGSLTSYTALTVQAGHAEAARLVPLTKALASEYALANAADNIQNHGGVGFTEACPAHLFLKRANVLATVLGTPAALWTVGLARTGGAED
jgi:alkylation response protein AidB-like acyl-CoA dehydrogenase